MIFLLYLLLVIAVPAHCVLILDFQPTIVIIYFPIITPTFFERDS